MADGYARSLGKPGLLCVVPGPGVTNSLTGLGEARVDSVPLVAIVGDIARGEKYRPFQVHCLDQAALLRPVTKGVFEVTDASLIPSTIRQAFALAMSGEPGPVAVVIPYTQLIDVRHFKDAPLASRVIPFDESACNCAIRMLSDKKLKVGIYAGQGCQDFSEQLTAVAEMLQAPVATSVSGKGVIHEGHPLSVGWGYGPKGTETAEKVFAGKLLPHHHGVDVLLAIGVRFSEVSTGFYSNPQTKHVIHVDSSKANIGQVLKTDVPVHADAGAFLAKLLEHAALLRRPADTHLLAHIRDGKAIENKHFQRVEGKHGADPQAFINALRKVMPEDGLLFVDVTVSEHLAAESYRVCRPRSYFNPTDNQAMGWSIPAALGAQKVNPSKVVATLTGDGCFLMTAMEISTAAREGLPVKFFILDDQAYHYMQMLQQAAYLRTTATILAHLDYPSLAKGLGVGYQEIQGTSQLEAGIRGALCKPGPVLTRIITDYGDRKVRWLDAVKAKYTRELSAAQKTRFLARAGVRAIDFRRAND